MRLLLVGGTRFVGRGIAERGLHEGHTVACLHRGETDCDLDVEHLVGDRETLSESATVIREWQPDAVVHCIAYTEHHAAEAVEALKGLRVAVVSSVDSFEAFSRIRRGEDPGPMPIDEDSERCRERYYLSDLEGAPEGYDKNLMNDGFLEAGRAGVLAPTILHLPMVWGPRDPQAAHRHGEILHHVLDRRERYVMGTTAASELWTFGYVDNCAAAVLAAIGTDATIGGAYVVGEAKWRTKRGWAELYADVSGRSLEVHTVDDALLDEEHDPTDAARHILSSSARLRTITGLTDPVPVEEAVARNIEWFAEHREDLGDPPDYYEREALLSPPG